MGAAYSPIPELNQLMEFQQRTSFEDYSEGFGLYDEYGTDMQGLETYLDRSCIPGLPGAFRPGHRHGQLLRAVAYRRTGRPCDAAGRSVQR